MANFKPLSRYTNGIVTQNRSGQDFLVLRPPLRLEPSDDDIFVTVTEQFVLRPDLVGFTAYGDRSLWWAIYEFNNIRDPFFELKAGQILRIPSRQRVITAISELNKV
jgi:hypothetical protein